jgi:two-component system response regulator DesR
MATHPKNLPTTLENWTLSGGSWRVVSISNGRAVVDRCSYTGEPLERLESDDPAVVAHLRSTHSGRVFISSSQSEQNGRGHTSPGVDSRTADIDLLIVDGQRVASPGLCTRQERQREIRIIASTESSEEALRLAREQNPQVCMVSATLDAGDWLSRVRCLKQLEDPPRVLIYGVSDYLMTGMAIVANADGVLRYGAPEELGHVVSRLAAGEKVYPDLQPDEVRELLDCVDDPDRAIVAMLLEGIPRGHIASTLGISARSLRLRRWAILTRLDAAQQRRGSPRRHAGG